MRKKGKADIRERFGFAVRARREELGLTQEEFAERARIHRTYVSDIERGSRNVSLVNIERVAAALALGLSECSPGSSAHEQGERDGCWAWLMPTALLGFSKGMPEWVMGLGLGGGSPRYCVSP